MLFRSRAGIYCCCICRCVLRSFWCACRSPQLSLMHTEQLTIRHRRSSEALVSLQTSIATPAGHTQRFLPSLLLRPRHPLAHLIIPRDAVACPSPRRPLLLLSLTKRRLARHSPRCTATTHPLYVVGFAAEGHLVPLRAPRTDLLCTVLYTN